ncbi:MAG: orotidine-5'-phosphate decarboxylase [Candidatus Omnitrophota bacterium]|nr:orotidine-5'-phosphate decarboxylase [Candidatus Omnitrophota bacterium]
MKRATQLILALDVATLARAEYFVRKLYPEIKLFKVGSQLFTSCGPVIIELIRKIGAQVFLDLKFNDIPNTMAAAAKEAIKHKVAMFTVHTLSGPAALKEVAMVCQGSATKALGVTILTSICPHFLRDLKIQRTLAQEALYLAKMAKRNGLNGIVCSAQEAKLMRKELGRNFLIVTPGIRAKTQKKADQKRVVTAEDAVKAGSDFLVVGRPILEAGDPLSVVKELRRSL